MRDTRTMETNTAGTTHGRNRTIHYKCKERKNSRPRLDTAELIYCIDEGTLT